MYKKLPLADQLYPLNSSEKNRFIISATLYLEKIIYGYGTYTCGNKIWPSSVPKNWNCISEEAPERLNNPRNLNDPKIHLSFRGLHFLLILHVIQCTNSAQTNTQTLAHAIHNDHAQHKAPMQLFTEHFEP
jgi:hypothetical protein